MIHFDRETHLFRLILIEVAILPSAEDGGKSFTAQRGRQRLLQARCLSHQSLRTRYHRKVLPEVMSKILIW